MNEAFLTVQIFVHVYILIMCLACKHDKSQYEWGGDVTREKIIPKHTSLKILNALGNAASHIKLI